MASRNSNKLPNNLPQLQNLIKRDRDSYKEEFLQQYHQYEANMKIFRLNPSEFSDSFISLITFISHVAHCYPEYLQTFPNDLVEILQRDGSSLNPAVRMTLCKVLMQLRKQNIVEPLKMHEVFFLLLRCQDKSLRKLLYNFLVQDIKNSNKKAKNIKLNTKLQNFMFSMLKDSNSISAKMALDIMIEMHKRNIWDDSKTVNVITTACFSKKPKILVAALKFFLGNDEDEAAESDSDSENEIVKKDYNKIKESTKKILLSHRVGKKTRKRQRKMEKALSNVKKNKKRIKTDHVNFPAIHVINDPQDFCEKLFKELDTTNERFEIKLMFINLIARLIGIHELILLNFYPYIQRYLQPHQKEVTKLMTYAAQSCHSLVPPDAISPLIMTVANNFISERNSSEAIAVGLNCVREIFARCPLALSEDLARDLAEYKKYKDKSVMMSARSLIGILRSKNMTLLHKRDRGRPTEATNENEILNYAQSTAKNYIPGAEILDDEVIKKKIKLDNTQEQNDEMNDDNDDKNPDDSWVLSNSEEEDSDNESNKSIISTKENDNEFGEWESCTDSENESDGSWIDVIHSSDEEITVEEPEAIKNMNDNEKIEQAQKMFESRIFTQNDFKKVKQRQKQKQTENFRKGGNNKIADDVKENESEIVSISRITHLHKKSKDDKEARIASIMAGREGREKYNRPEKRQNPNASTTNREKQKGKNFSMMRPKLRAKKKRSFQEKQRSIKGALLRQLKSKK